MEGITVEAGALVAVGGVWMGSGGGATTVDVGGTDADVEVEAGGEGGIRIVVVVAGASCVICESTPLSENN